MYQAGWTNPSVKNGCRLFFMTFFCKIIFSKFFPGTLSECQTVGIQNVGPDLVANCLQMLSANDKCPNKVVTL